MKYLTAILLFLALNSCQRAKTLTYEAALENCIRMQTEMQQKNPNEMSLQGPDCIIGAQIPEFEGTTLEGKKINKAALKGKPSIINFWFTTCAPCVAEIPGLDSIARKFGTDKINYIAIGRDDSLDIKEFLAKNPWKFEHIPNGIDIMQHNFKLRWGFPTTFVLNKNTEIIHVLLAGKTDSTAIEEIQNKLIPVIEKALKY